MELEDGIGGSGQRAKGHMEKGEHTVWRYADQVQDEELVVEVVGFVIPAPRLHIIQQSAQQPAPQQPYKPIYNV